MINRAKFRISCLIISVVVCFSFASSSYAKNITYPAHVWVLLSSSPLQTRPVELSWLRAQEKDKLLQILAPLTQINGIVVPAFDEGRALYATQVVPFKDRNSEAEPDEAALRSLLAASKKQNVPVYLSIDVLAWQKSDLTADPPTVGIFAQHPDWRETRQQGVQPQTPEAFYASPWQPEVRGALLDLISEIGRKFPEATGLVLNLRLSDREILGFSEAARLASIRDLGLDPFDLNMRNRADDDNNALVEKWRSWRLAQISALLKELRATYVKACPSGRVLTFGTADYYDRQEFNDLRSSQDWRGWLEAKVADGVLLAGRWTPRYNDASTFAGTYAKGEATRNVVPLSAGSQVVADSSYAQDWSALSTRIDALNEMAFAVRSDADLKSVVRLGTGAEKSAPPPAPAVNEPFPDLTLRQPDGETWQARDARGKTALALLLNPAALPGAANAANAALANLSDALQLVIVTDAAPAARPVLTSLAEKSAREPLRLADVRRDLLSFYGERTNLLLVDRAGWLRRVEAPANAEAFNELLHNLYDPTPQLTVGKPAPDFILPDMNGTLRRLSDLRGQSNLLLTFFPKCFTGGCSNHLTSLRDKRAEFEAANTYIWAVSIDPADVQIAFAKSLNLPFPLLPDTGRHLSLLYEAAQNVNELSARCSVLIDKEGIVRWIDHDVRVKTHGPDIIAKMRELGLMK